MSRLLGAQRHFGLRFGRCEMIQEEQATLSLAWGRAG